MADKLKDWSTTPSSNNQTPPNGWPEGMAPSKVNDTARTDRARMREWYEDPVWLNLDHSIQSVTSSTVVISGDVTGVYVADRAIRLDGDNDLRGWVSSSSYSSPNTTVTVTGVTVPTSPDASLIEVAQTRDARDVPRGVLGYDSGYLDGLELSLDADADHDVKVATGACRDSSNSVDVDLDAIITKQLDATWAEGDDAGGRASAVTLSGPELLFVFLIGKTDGTVDAGFDTSPTAANLLSDASSYTYYRMIGSGLTDASNNWSRLYNYGPGQLIDYQVFTSSGTRNKPSIANGSDTVLLELWGAGGSGAVCSSFYSLSQQATGGGGGTYFRASVREASMGSSESITVGTGGAAIGPAGQGNGNDGGNTSVLNFIAQGGPGGEYGNPVTAPTGAGYDFGNGSFLRLDALWYGGEPGHPDDTTDPSGLYGAGGGAGVQAGDGSTTPAGGTSWKGGDGGAGATTTSVSATASAGTAPGGGGGAAGNSADTVANVSGAGADGQAIISVFRGWCPDGFVEDVTA